METTTPPLSRKNIEEDILLAYISSTCYAFAETLIEQFGDVYEISFTVEKIDGCGSG